MKVEYKIILERFRFVCFVCGVWFLGVLFGGSLIFVAIEGRDYLGYIEYTDTIELNPINVSVAHEKPVETIVWSVGEFSAYTSASDETDEDGETMASGKKVYIGSIACPSFLKLGQKVEVKDKGIFTCEDRMNKRYREMNHFDIYHETKAEAFAFGRKQLKWRAL